MTISRKQMFELIIGLLGNHWDVRPLYFLMFTVDVILDAFDEFDSFDANWNKDESFQSHIFSCLIEMCGTRSFLQFHRTA